MACWPPCNPWCECVDEKCQPTEVKINGLRLRTRDGRYLYADNGGTDYKSRLLATDVLNPVWETFLFIPPTKWPLTSGDSISLVVTDGYSGPTAYMVRAEYSLYIYPRERGVDILWGYDFGGPGTRVWVCGPLSTDIGHLGYSGNDEREWIFTIEKNGGGRINTGDEISLRINRRHSDSVPSAFYFRTAGPENWAEIAADGTAPFQADTVFVVEFNEVRFGLGWRPSSIDCQACGTVTGTVTDALTGRPIAGAKVESQGVFENHPFSGITNDKGYFILKDPEGRTCVATGNIRLRASADRHQSKTIDPISVPSEGGVVVPIQLDCTKVSGRVIDDAGKGVPNKTVYLRDQSSPPKIILDENGNPYKTTTAADGSFVFNCVSHGYIQVWTTADQSQMQHTKVVPPEGWTNVIIVVQVTCGNLVGKVTDADTGQGIKDATVTLPNGLTTTTREDGSFTFTCVKPAGEYDVIASAPGYIEDFATGNVPTTGDSATVNIKLKKAVEMLQIWNTGVDANAAKLPPGSSDPHWQLVASPGFNSPRAAYVVSDQRSGNYFSTTDSTWIWENVAGSAMVGGVPYTFRLSFDLTGFDPASVTITGAWGVDNNGQILLNGSPPVGTGLSLTGADINNFQIEHNFEIVGGFQAGVNSLEIRVTNAGNAVDPVTNPAGLNVTKLKIIGSRTAK